MKIKGQDIIDFFKTWPPGDDVYYDDAAFSEREDGILCEFDGMDYGAPVDPIKTYKGCGGYLGWQGEGPIPEDFNEDLEAVFLKWLKAKTTTILIIEVPNAEAQAAKDLLKSKGWKVKS